MAQTIVVQETALQEAQRRIEELEQGRTERQGRGLVSGIFGSAQNAGRTSVVPSVSRAKASTPDLSPVQGGRTGFLAGAAQTAMGVAGGLLLGNFIGGMLGGNEAQAADASPEPEPQPETDADADQGEGMFGGFLTAAMERSEPFPLDRADTSPLAELKCSSTIVSDGSS
jgi:hypothetical protein